MYIKAKYPEMGREWYRQGIQGFGSTYGGNQISDVSQVSRNEEITEEHEGQFNKESQQTI